jgi:hypothetical protein
VKKDWKLLSFGLPKRRTKSFSELTVTGSNTGPHGNTPAKAPIDDDTAGTIEVKSFSTTATPGDNWNGIVFLLVNKFT